MIEAMGKQTMINVGGKDIKIRGRLIRAAGIDGDQYRFVDDPEAVIAGLRRSRCRADLFTFMQRLPETKPKYHYPMEWDNFAALPVSTYDAWFTQQIDSKTRNIVRKAAKKGVETREVAFDENLVWGIRELYNECPVRQGRPFAHYGMDADTVRQHAGTFPGVSFFLGAFFEEKLIGFVKLTTDETNTQAGVMHILSMMQHRDKAPTNALIAQAVRSCAERGIPYLVYASFAYGKKQQSSLIDFKVNNGFQRIDVPRYYVPLTALGSVALRLRLHHALADRLPESVTNKIRDLRRAWYDRKFQSAMGSL